MNNKNNNELIIIYLLINSHCVLLKFHYNNFLYVLHVQPANSKKVVRHKILNLKYELIVCKRQRVLASFKCHLL